MMRVMVVPGTLAVCRLDPHQEIPGWARSGGFYSLTSTDEELSLVCAQEAVPSTVRSELGWRALKVLGPLDFALTGILAALAVPLAAAQIPIFALSTFDTDYILLKEHHLPLARVALEQAGHSFVEN